ncbi:hypothetical protein M3Y99_01317900 [Aphelenchoides fujianensis]|nr:hypothetical protein M3Y99_01317900 [Aphelenchoides fujianensis]
MADPYACLRCTSIGIAVYNLIYTLVQFGVLGWQVQVVKERQWEYENRQLPPTHAIDGFQARFPGLYAIYTETPDRRRTNAMFVLVLICLGLSFLHLLTTSALLYAVIKRSTSWMCPWFFTAAPLIALVTAYSILWWSGDVFNEQLTMSVAEFVLSLAINGPAFIVVLMYYLRITGRLRSEKPRQLGPVRQPEFLPPDVPPWQARWPEQPPYEVQRKLRRRERSRSRSPPRRPPSQPFSEIPTTSAEFARRAQLRNSARRSGSAGTHRRSQRSARPPSALKSRSTTPAGRLSRRSPQRVSFNSRPKVYQRTPESSLSGGRPRLEIQTVV